ncbi:MAG: beta-propeller domain-containing protein [Propionibacteriaceae bacterium]|jgi:uncharacterized secreted protein with C-terminal beta-propeller domain|nr:beta-propeller domain-containing protein [Propionibacteriaceae bacterium]
MTEKNDFHDTEGQMTTPPNVPAARAAASARPNPRSRRRRTALAAAAAAVLAVALGVAPLVHGRIGWPPIPGATSSPVDEGPVGRRPADESTFALATVDYAQVYDAFRAAWSPFYRPGGSRGMIIEESGPGEFSANDAAQAPGTAQASGGDTVSGGSFTGTNVQVRGVDEGDVVKTDGQTIFVANGQRVALVAASGADTAALGSIDITASYTPRATGHGLHNVLGDVIDLMLAEDRLVVLANDYSPRHRGDWMSDTADVEFVAERTLALVYDVTDPSDPVFVTSLGQSGAHTTSRLQDGVLYLVSDYVVVSEAAPDPDDLTTFVPLVSDATGIEPLPAADIALFPSPDGPRYALASAIDVATGARIAQQAVLGGADTVYMSADNLYLAVTDWSYGDAVPEATLAAVGLADATGVNAATHIARLSLTGLTVAAETTLPGQPVNQFAFDEHDGHLRAVLTVQGRRDRRWTTRASLVVLDADLKAVGSIASLVDGETVKSARFQATVVHIVTFRQTDPLFSVDLSDPAHPAVQSALKIPGFSAYLHPWAEGLLLGFGRDGDANGRLDVLKLSMYDTSDPFSVHEVTTLKVPFYKSEAMDDHKAILVDTERGIVGFPVLDEAKRTEHYLVYRYDAGQFSLSQDLEVAQGDARYYTPPPVRGLLVADNLYVASEDAVSAYALDHAHLATVTL